MAGMIQRPGKKGRRGERPGAARSHKTSPGDSLAHLLSPNSVGDGVYSNPPLAHTLVSLIGCVVEVQLVSGDVCEGVLRAISPSMEISLNVAHIKGQPPTTDSVYNRKDISFAEVVTISAKTGTNPQLDIFKTDTEISGHSNGPQKRELQPFTDFSGDGNNLDIVGSSEGDGWSVEEMFAVNQNKFQVSSTYDEEMPQYTTPLARDGERYKKREMEAIQLANEIEGRSTLSRHAIDDLGSEEDRWSSVLREPEMSQPSTAVKENGVTTSHVTPHTQAPPISTPPLLLAPPTSTPSPSPIVPPSPQTNSTISDSETTPPAPPTSSASPGNNQTSLSDDVIAAVKDVGDKINEGEAPEISGEGSSEPQHTSLGPSLVGEGEGVAAGEESQQPPFLQSPTSGEGETEVRASSSTPEPAKAAEKEKAIKNFKLDPTAKEFVASSFLSSPISSSAASPGLAVSMQSSPSSTHSQSYTRTHPHTPRSGGRYPGNSSPRVRPSTAGNMYSHASFSSDPIIHTAVASNYMLSQQAASGAMAGILRPGAFPQYAVPHGPLVGGVIPQIIAANPHSPVIGGGAQQQFPLMQQPQLFQHTQPIMTPQGIVMPAPGQSLYMGGALSLMHQPQMMAVAAAAAGVPQVNPPSAVQQGIAGTTAASGVPRGVGRYQMPGAGK